MFKKIVLAGVVVAASFLSFHLGYDNKVSANKVVACNSDMCYGEYCPNGNSYIHGCCCQ